MTKTTQVRNTAFDLTKKYENINLPKGFKIPKDWNGKIVICVDAQNDFLDKENYSDASLPVPGAGGSHAESIKKFNESQEAQGTLVIYTKDWHPANHKSYLENHQEALLEGKATFIPLEEGFKDKDEATQQELLSKYRKDYTKEELSETPPFGHVIYKEGGKLTTYDVWPVHCVQGSEGAKLAKEFGDVEKDHIVALKGVNPEHAGYSGCQGTDLEKLIKYLVTTQNKKAEIIVNGYARDYCVNATACDLAQSELAKEGQIEVAIDNEFCKGIVPFDKERLESDAKNGIRNVLSPQFLEQNPHLKDPKQSQRTNNEKKPKPQEPRPRYTWPTISSILKAKDQQKALEDAPEEVREKYKKFQQKHSEDETHAERIERKREESKNQTNQNPRS